MAYTRHGHHIPGTVLEEPRPPVARCGGPKICNLCAFEVGKYSRENLESEHEQLIRSEKETPRVSVSDIQVALLEHNYSYNGRCQCGEFLGNDPAKITRHVAEMVYRALPGEIRG